jgi:hypothetical protein
MRQNFGKKPEVRRMADGGSADDRSLSDKFFDWIADKDTRSVMDKPQTDMRDAQYRKELEQKQALQEPPISPEDVLLPAASKISGMAKRLKAGEQMAVRQKPDISHIDDKWKAQEHAANLEKREKEYYNKKYDDKYSPFTEARKKYERAEAESDHFNPNGPYKKSTDTLAERVQKEGTKHFQKRLIDQKEKEMMGAANKKARENDAKKKIISSMKESIIPSSAGHLGGLAMEIEDQLQGRLDSLRSK